MNLFGVVAMVFAVVYLYVHVRKIAPDISTQEWHVEYDDWLENFAKLWRFSVEPLDFETTIKKVRRARRFALSVVIVANVALVVFTLLIIPILILGGAPVLGIVFIMVFIGGTQAMLISAYRANKKRFSVFESIAIERHDVEQNRNDLQE